MLCSMLSNTVKTEIIENIPIVIPRRESTVLTLFTTKALIANSRLSYKSLRIIIGQNLYQKECFFKKRKNLPNKYVKVG